MNVPLSGLPLIVLTEIAYLSHELDSKAHQAFTSIAVFLSGMQQTIASFVPDLYLIVPWFSDSTVDPRYAC